MANRINSLPIRDRIYLSYFYINKIKTTVTYAGVNLQVFNQDQGWHNNENEDRVIADLLVPARNSIATAFIGLTTWWAASSPNMWGDFSHQDTVLARSDERVSKAFAARSLEYTGNLGAIYCDRYYIDGLTAWNTTKARFSAQMAPVVIEPLDEAFIQLDMAYQSAKQHCASIAAS